MKSKAYSVRVDLLFILNKVNKKIVIDILQLRLYKMISASVFHPDVRSFKTILKFYFEYCILKYIKNFTNNNTRRYIVNKTNIYSAEVVNFHLRVINNS